MALLCRVMSVCKALKVSTELAPAEATHFAELRGPCMPPMFDPRNKDMGGRQCVYFGDDEDGLVCLCAVCETYAWPDTVVVAIDDGVVSSSRSDSDRL